MPPTPTNEECHYIALQLEKGGYGSIPPSKEPNLLEAAEFRLLVQQTLGRYRPSKRPRQWHLGIASSLQSNGKHHEGLQGMADATTTAELKRVLADIPARADKLEKDPPFQPFGREEALAQAAASWFKHEYFRWVDPIKCAQCGGDTECTGADQPSASEREGGAGRCELWTCKTCHAVRRFPRLNRISALMESREGRCGEFAQLFYAVCLVLGLEGRYVWNSEDHVWTEFWSPTAGHWVHVDSCEAEVGKPLLYDRGWGKKQAYCIAFGPYGAEDVTRAYVDDWGECLQRRAEKRFNGQPTSERDLARALASITVKVRRDMSEEEKARLASMDEAQARWIDDTNRRSREGEQRDLKGRDSGTQEWKEERGETGDQGTEGAKAE